MLRHEVQSVESQNCLSPTAPGKGRKAQKERIVNIAIMNTDRFLFHKECVYLRRFSGEGRAEVHAVLHPAAGCISFESQLADIETTLESLLESERRVGREMKVALKRSHLSDSVNQSEMAQMPAVGQPPADGGRIAMLVILIESAVAVNGSSTTMIIRGDYTDFWHFRNSVPGESLYDATENSLRGFDRMLSAAGCSLADNCVRTWFWIRDIDARYTEMVKGRNNVFKSAGLSPATHFIASTGIGADLATPDTPLLFGALAIKGIDEDQIHYIKAHDHLNDTIDYGVAFERATAVDYGDRRVVYVSGTASIDSNGAIYAPCDPARQTERMCDNIDALLLEAGCSGEDLMHGVLYVRDAADFSVAKRIVARRYPGVPVLCVRACVCRPGWLVEMECVAVKPQKDERYPDY